MMQEQSSVHRRRKSSLSAGAYNPSWSRLLDYYVEVTSENPATSCPNNLEDCRRYIVRRIPEINHLDFPLPDGVPYFCIPDGFCLETQSEYERRPIFFAFSLTAGDGSRAYGFALHFYDELPDNKWRPRVYCLISHHPFFSLFKEIVSLMYRMRNNNPSGDHVIETEISSACVEAKWLISPQHNRECSFCSSQKSKKYEKDFPEDEEETNIYSIVQELVSRVLAPSPGTCLALQIRGKDFFKYHVPRGKLDHLDDYCFRILFQCLGLKNVIFILNCMLLEQRILIHTIHPGLLTPVCEALCALMFPFTWEHVYIPFLPVNLIEYLHAPVPYLMGLQTSSLSTSVGAEIFASCIVVHLDKDKVVSPMTVRPNHTSGIDFNLARLPVKEVDAVIEALSRYIPTPAPAVRREEVSMEQVSRIENNHKNEIELIFGEGPLGITFESTHLRLLAVGKFQKLGQVSPSAVVKALPKLKNGLPGPAEMSGMIVPGSFLIGINGDSTLDLTFEETLDRLRTEKRPLRLRFQNSELPYENACQFAQRLEAFSFISTLDIEESNQLLEWVDKTRSRFAQLFATIFCNFQKFVRVHHDVNVVNLPSTRNPHIQSSKMASRGLQARSSVSVSFDNDAFISHSNPVARPFLREFIDTQAFLGFVNESILERISHLDAYPQVEVFKHCIHLLNEAEDPQTAISMLLERDPVAIEYHTCDMLS